MRITTRRIAVNGFDFAVDEAGERAEHRDRADEARARHRRDDEHADRLVGLAVDGGFDGGLAGFSMRSVTLPAASNATTP